MKSAGRIIIAYWLAAYRELCGKARLSFKESMAIFTKRSSTNLHIPSPPLSKQSFHHWLNVNGGYKDVWHLAWPLFLAQGSSTILQFTDRMFLTWYSAEGMAAAGPAGMLAFSMQAFFIGMTGYSSVFVAQYTGAKKPSQAVSVVWQALYLSIASSVILLLGIPLGGMVFKLAGHPEAIRRYERIFFDIFLLGSAVFLSNAAVSGYFIGKGRTRVVLLTNIIGVLTNIISDYLLIFGNLGFPRMGVAGAAISSIIAQTLGLIINIVFFLRDPEVRKHSGAWKPRLELITRIIRFGSANGLQFALDMLGWTTFLLLVGRMGVVDLAASNIAFQINTFAFFPIIGFAMAASTLVGQNLGRNDADGANRSVWSAMHIGLMFTGIVAVFYVFAPDIFIAPFGAEANKAEFAPVRHLSIILLRFISAYCLFDVGNLVLSAALKGAGDTLFVMLISSSISVCCMLLPVFFLCVPAGGLGVIGAWCFLTLTVLTLSIAFLLRYLHGRWQHMRVIECEVV
jgi:MATE family multidrug resistance protein